jgi:hypothetical protein
LALRMYVISLLGPKSQTDHPVAFFGSQPVRDLPTAVQNHKLTIPRGLLRLSGCM